jgi:hypothetical protein
MGTFIEPDIIVLDLVSFGSDATKSLAIYSSSSICDVVSIANVIACKRERERYKEMNGNMS